MPGARLEVRSGAAAEHVVQVARAEQADMIALAWSRQLGQGRARVVLRAACWPSATTCGCSRLASRRARCRGSGCSGRRSSQWGAPAAEAAHALAAYAALADADIIHDHTDLGPRLAGRRGITRPPVVTTVHGLVTPGARRLLAETARHAAIVAISYAQARSFGGVPVAAVIHHGIDLDVYTPGPGTGGYLLFVGRMSADKGVHHAVRAARLAGWPLVISAKMREPAERAYFEEQVRPLLGPDDIMSAELPLTIRLPLMRDAAALLNPITWPEPFGLVMAEALACATPVLAFPNGAAPEIIDHGRTGYLCQGEEDMTAAIADVHQIDRRQCRAAAEQRFSLTRMAVGYERLYRAILARPGQLAPGRAEASVR